MLVRRRWRSLAAIAVTFVIRPVAVAAGVPRLSSVARLLDHLRFVSTTNTSCSWIVPSLP